MTNSTPAEVEQMNRPSPCPFCDSADIEHHADGDGNGWHVCKSCGARGPLENMRQSSDDPHWENRAHHKQVLELQDELKKLSAPNASVGAGDARFDEVEQAYIAMLRIPHTYPIRWELQSALATMRDNIAEAKGIPAEVIQNECEALASTPTPIPDGDAVAKLKRLSDVIDANSYSHNYNCDTEMKLIKEITSLLASAPSRSVDVTGVPENMIADIEAHVRGAREKKDGYEYALGSGWRCFHCGEMFRTPGGAALHFGKPDDKPACSAPSREKVLEEAAQQLEKLKYDLRGEDFADATPHQRTRFAAANRTIEFHAQTIRALKQGSR